jgi:hypothetical protein
VTGGSGEGGEPACIFMVWLAKTSRQPQNDGSLDSRVQSMRGH